MIKYIKANEKPIAFCILCTAVGFIAGNAAIGLAIALAIIALAHLFT
jgi:hypothetical protein